jgi:hypothetical protein
MDVLLVAALLRHNTSVTELDLSSNMLVNAKDTLLSDSAVTSVSGGDDFSGIKMLAEAIKDHPKINTICLTGQLWDMVCELWSIGGQLGSMACELWSTACDLWSTGCELWSMACELWSMVYELWSTGCELWTTACELWSMVYELWSMACEMWSTACKLWPTYADSRGRTWRGESTRDALASMATPAWRSSGREVANASRTSEQTPSRQTKAVAVSSVASKVAPSAART